MDLIKYSERVARENMPEHFARELCFQINQIDNLFARFEKQKHGNNIYLAVGFFSLLHNTKPQEFCWLIINLNHNSKEIKVIWDKFSPKQKFSLHCCGILQRAILNYISLRRGELLALLCWENKTVKGWALPLKICKIGLFLLGLLCGSSCFLLFNNYFFKKWRYLAMNGYFACPLASNRDRKTALAFVEVIESLGHKILDRHVVAEEGKGQEEFCKNSGIDPKDFNPKSVRKQDLEWLMQSKFMVLDYTCASWGGGIEFDHATVLRKALGLEPIPILCLRHKDAKPSWLILGIDKKEFPAVSLVEYTSVDQGKRIIENFFALLPLNLFPYK